MWLRNDFPFSHRPGCFGEWQGFEKLDKDREDDWLSPQQVSSRRFENLALESSQPLGVGGYQIFFFKNKNLELLCLKCLSEKDIDLPKYSFLYLPVREISDS